MPSQSRWFEPQMVSIVNFLMGKWDPLVSQDGILRWQAITT
jgi:hypothetical protein